MIVDDIINLLKTTQAPWKTVEVRHNNIGQVLKNIPNHPGIYQIKTNAPIAALQQVAIRKDASHYNLRKKIDAAMQLPQSFIIAENLSMGYVVYTGHQAKLRQRCKEHFIGSKGTGCLNIFEDVHLRSYDWWFQYLDCTDVFENYQDSKLYRTYLEQLHRSNIRWPILCSQ